jgi:hypothetical protein
MMEPRKRFTILIGVILLIIILVTLIFLITKPGSETDTASVDVGDQVQEETQAERVSREVNELINRETGNSIDIREFSLLESFAPGDGFDNYVVRTDDTYESGEIMIYYVIEKIQPVEENGKYVVSFSNRIELDGPEGTVAWFNDIYSFDRKKEVASSDLQQLPVLIRADVSEINTTGVYFLNVEVTNNKLPQRAKEQIAFAIR